jgi:maltose/maltodextrin transport system permease protein
MAIVIEKNQRWRLLGAYVFLGLLCLVVVFPFLVVLSVSLRPGNFAVGSLIPQTISLEHWRYAVGLPYQAPDGRLIQPELPVLRWLWNSIKLGTLSAAITLLFSTTGAYALARLRFAGREKVLTGLMLMQMFPAVLALVAIYAIFDHIGAVFPAFGIDTHLAVLLAYSGGMAMHIWTIKGYYDTIPFEIEEAAKVDGATPWQSFYMVLLPMAVPILVVVFLLSFIGTVIEYPVASVLLHQEQNLTLAVGIQKFVDDHNFRWGDFAAVAIISGFPITVVFLVAQRYMVAGLTAGGIKG